MDSFFIFIVFMIISAVLGSISKKNSQKQKEAIEEQRRRRQVYESTQQQQEGPSPNQPSRQPAREVTIPDLGELFGEVLVLPVPQQPLNRRMQPQEVKTPAYSVMPEAIAEEQSAAKPIIEQTKPQTVERIQQKAAVPLFADSNALVQGIIMAEVLGEPRCRRNGRTRI